MSNKCFNVEKFNSGSTVLAVSKDLIVHKVESEKHAFEMNALFAIESFSYTDLVTSATDSDSFRFVEHIISVHTVAQDNNGYVIYKGWKMQFSTGWDAMQLTKARVFGKVVDPLGNTSGEIFFGTYTDGIEEALAYLKMITAYQCLEHYESLKKIEKLRTKMAGVQVDLMKKKEAIRLLKEITAIVRR